MRVSASNLKPPEHRVTRRAATTALLSVLAGCASQISREPTTKLQATRIAFSGPSYDPDVAVAGGSSAAAVREAKGVLNRRLAGWYDVVIPGFTNAFTTALANASMAVEQASWGAPLIPSVRCFLTAGFVDKTFLSSTYAPFVQVVSELGAPGGRIVYHQLYVATDRPFNMFMNSIPANTHFLLEDLSSLSANSKPALDALQSLAAQLGEKFAGEILARTTLSSFLGVVPHEV
jgi:hypothetical protein